MFCALVETIVRLWPLSDRIFCIYDVLYSGHFEGKFVDQKDKSNAAR